MQKKSDKQYKYREKGSFNSKLSKSPFMMKLSLLRSVILSITEDGWGVTTNYETEYISDTCTIKSTALPLDIQVNSITCLYFCRHSKLTKKREL